MNTLRILLFVLLIILMIPGCEESYIKISNDSRTVPLETLKKNKIEYQIKEDGSVWIKSSDQEKLATCCT